MTLVFNPHHIQAEPSLRIGIPCNLLFTAPLGDVHTSRQAPSAEAVWIFRVESCDTSAVLHPPRSSANITINVLKPMGRCPLANGTYSDQEIQQWLFGTPRNLHHPTITPEDSWQSCNSIEIYLSLHQLTLRVQLVRHLLPNSSTNAGCRGPDEIVVSGFKEEDDVSRPRRSNIWSSKVKWLKWHISLIQATPNAGPPPRQTSSTPKTHASWARRRSNHPRPSWCKSCQQTTMDHSAPSLCVGVPQWKRKAFFVWSASESSVFDRQLSSWSNWLQLLAWFSVRSGNRSHKMDTSLSPVSWSGLDLRAKCETHRLSCTLHDAWSTMKLAFWGPRYQIQAIVPSLST